MIPKGTRVAITTTNGGASEAILTADYRPTFAAFLQTDQGHPFVVDAHRLRTIVAVA